ncbi:MAG: 50S ribosomal protein L24 [Patescibacteria group bacterium]
MATLLKIKRGDSVQILRGRDAQKKGKVLAVLPKAYTVVVEGLNMVKKHVKAKSGGQKGQRVSIAAPIRIANVQLICTQCKKGTRVGITRENGVRSRVCKQCKATIE